MKIQQKIPIFFDTHATPGGQRAGNACMKAGRQAAGNKLKGFVEIKKFSENLQRTAARKPAAKRPEDKSEGFVEIKKPQD